MIMKNNKNQLYMKLDRFKKSPRHSTSKERTMGILPKVALMFVSGRFVLGLVLIIAAAAWANENILKAGIEPKCWFSMAGDTAMAKGVVTKIEFIALGLKNRNDYKVHYTFVVDGKTYEGASFQEGLVFRKNEAIDVTYSVKDPSCSCGGGVKCPAEDAMYTIIFGGLLLLIAIFLVQSGIKRIFHTIALIEYGTFTTAEVRGISGSTTSTRGPRKWVASCGYKDSSGKDFRFDVIFPTEKYLKKGDLVGAVYDPGMPANALAIDALPFFVKNKIAKEQKQ
jgi:hypothetical protein